MPLYLTCQLDGNVIHGKDKPEGFGSLFHYLLGAYAIAKRKNIQFYYTPITNVGHCEGTQEEWDKKCNDLIKKYLLPNLILELDNKTIIHIKCKEDIDKYDVSEDNIILNLNHGNMKGELDGDITLLSNIRDDLINYYYNNYSKNINININVALHIRKFNNFDCDLSPFREYYQPGNFMNTYFINKINEIYNNLNNENMIFHIYSQGNENEFKSFMELDKNIVLHLNESMIDTFHSFINADIFVMSKSCLSYIAAIYSKGFKMIRPVYPHPFLSDVYITY